MVVYIGADHRGFELKERLKVRLHNKGYEVADLGAREYDKGDDYPDFAKAVAEKVSRDPESSRGILICGSGVGMDVAANKYRDVHSALAINTDQIFDARHDDNVNVLSLAADFVTEEDALKIVGTFLETPFGGDERFKRRLEKISEIENR